MTLDELADREAIRQVIYTWFRAIDRLDPDLAHTAFWDEATMDGVGPKRPAREFVPALLGPEGRFRKAYTHTSHYAVNSLVDWRGDTAQAETYAVAYHRLPKDREILEGALGHRFQDLGGDPDREYDLTVGVRYLDRFEKREGVWKVAAKKLILDWTQAGLYTGLIEGGMFAAMPYHAHRGDRSDPSYDWKNL